MCLTRDTRTAYREGMNTTHESDIVAVLSKHVYGEFRGGLSEAWTTCTCGAKIDATFGGGRTTHEVFVANWAAHIAAALAEVGIQ